MIVIWRSLFERVHLHMELLWGNVRFFFSIILGFLTAYFIIFGMEIGTLPPYYKPIALIILSVTMIGIAEEGARALSRTYRKWLERVAYLSKVEEILGFAQPRKSKIWCKDQYLFDRYVKRWKEYESSETFIEGELEEPDTVYQDLKRVYNRIETFGSILMILSIVLYYLTLAERYQ